MSRRPSTDYASGSTLSVNPVTFVEVGAARFKGFTQPVEVFEPVMVRTDD
jgi:hypothetical protein